MSTKVTVYFQHHAQVVTAFCLFEYNGERRKLEYKISSAGQNSDYITKAVKIMSDEKSLITKLKTFVSEWLRDARARDENITAVRAKIKMLDSVVDEMNERKIWFEVD